VKEKTNDLKGTVKDTAKEATDSVKYMADIAKDTMSNKNDKF
jgi:uncharacterized protein YdhG (YjbR/CyaY superfamily)